MLQKIVFKLNLSRYCTAFLSLSFLFFTTTGLAQDYADAIWIVEEKSHPKIIEFDGKVQAIERATVAAQTSGRIVELIYDIGDFVPGGEVIARITSIAQSAQLEAALNQEKEAQAHLYEAQANFSRSQAVFEKKLIPKAEFDRAQANLTSAQAKTQSARANVTAARENLTYTSIRAPYSGYVVERFVQLGETVNPGTPLFSGVSLNRLRVIVNVPQYYSAAVREYSSADILLPNGQKIHENKIRIPPQADENNHTFRILIDLPENTPSVFPGTLVKTLFRIGEDRSIVVPKNALSRRGELTAVYLLNEQNQIRLRYVRTGAEIDGYVVILSGLHSGEQILRDPLLAAQWYKQQSHEGE